MINVVPEVKGITSGVGSAVISATKGEMDQQASGSTIKLEGQRNWSLWKFQVTVLLRGLEVFSVVDGTEVKRATNEVEWNRKDAKAQSLIVTRLSENVMIHILTCETSAQMWNKLLTVYEQKSTTSLHLLQQRFFNFKFEDGTDITLFLSKIQEMRTQLKNHGEELSEKFIMTKILMSLPDRYGYFISAWESVSPEKQNYNELVARLLTEEERMKSKEKDEENVAMFVKRVNKEKGKFDRKCFKCGNMGHVSAECRSSKDIRKCFICNRIGHLKSQCTKRRQSDKVINNNNGAFSVTFENDMNHRQSKWIIDSGASEHMVSERDLFTSLTEVTDRSVVVGDGRHLPVLGVGIVPVVVYNGQNYVKTSVEGVLYVPALKSNLFSVPSATNKGYEVDLSKSDCRVYKNGELCAIGQRDGNIYFMDFRVNHREYCTVSLVEWHERFCHQGMDHVKELLNNNKIDYIGEKDLCVACAKGKAHRLSFPTGESNSKGVLELLSADVCGPFEVESVGASKYFLLIKDDYSKYRFVYFLKRKSEVASRVKEFIAMAERQTGCCVKVFRSDNGKEFVNEEMNKLFKGKGIIHQTTVPYTPQQNGKAERDMRTLVEAARTMLSAACVGKDLWAEAINMAVYVLNRTSKSRQEGKSPYQVFTGKEFDISSLNKVFGSKVFAHIPKQKRTKLDIKAKEAIFVGYAETKGYRVYYNENNSVEIERDIIFTKEVRKEKLKKKK